MDIKSISVEVKAKGIIPAANALGKFSKTAQEGAPAISAAKQALEDFAAITLDAATSGVKNLSGAIRDIKTNTKGISNLGQSYKGVSTSFTALATAVERLNSSVTNMAAFNAQLAVTRDLLNEMKGSAGVLSSLGRSAGTATVSASSGGGRSGGSESDALTRSQQNLLKEVERGAIYVERGKAGWLEYKAAQLGVSDAAAPFIARMRGVNNTLQQGTMSTKAYRAAMNQVPMQLTDIVTQLAGGQNPFLIMIQQGGQLRDVFGSVGGAAKALGSTVLRALLNPWTLLAGAVAATAFAFYKAYAAQAEIQKALVLTNNYVGLTTASIQQLSVSVGVAAGNMGIASEAVLLLASSGKVAGSAVEGIAIASTKFAAATGTDIAKVVEEYASLSDNPVKALETLDKKYKFLTKTQQDHIVELQRQGKETEALAMAQNLLADAHSKMAKQIVSDQGIIMKFLDRQSEAWGALWAKIKLFGSEGKKEQEQMIEASQRVADAIANRAKIEQKAASGNEAAQRQLKMYDEVIAKNRAIYDTIVQRRKVEADNVDKGVQEDRVKSIGREADALDKALQRTTAISKYRADIDILKKQPQTEATIRQIKSLQTEIVRLQELGEPKKLTGGVTRQNTLEAEYEAILLDIQGYQTKGAEYDKLSEKGKRLLAVENALAKPKKDTNVPALKEELMWLKLIVAEEPKREGLRNAAKEAQGWLEIGDAANVAADAINKNTQFMAENGLESSRRTETQKKLAEAEDAFNKATDYGVKMNAAWAVSALTRKDAAERASAAMANSQKIANDNIELEKQQNASLALLREKYTEEGKAVEMDNEVKQRRVELMKLEAEVTKQVAAAEADIAILRKDSSVDHTEEIGRLNERIAKLKEFGAEQAKIIQNAPIKPDIQKGWESFYTSIGKSQDAYSSAFSSTFSLMENTLEEFFTSGKMNAQDFGKSMLKIITQMVTKLLLLKAVQAAVGMGDSSAGVSSAAASMSDFSARAQGGAFAGASQFAQGGSFTNGIYNKPTAFQFASGAGFSSLGVMGEERSNRAGEAVMPLSRTRQGDLAVNVTGQGGGAVQVNTTINIVGDSATTSTSSDGTEGRQFANMINTMIVRKIAEEKRPGGLLAKAA